MAKSNINAKNASESLEDFLAQSNEKLVTNWTTLASLIRKAENIPWDQARVKAVALQKDHENAFAYIEGLRAELRGEVKPVERESKKAATAENADPSGKGKNSKSKLEKPVESRDVFHMNYKRLLKVVPDLEERLVNGEDVYGKSKRTGYMAFNLELNHTDKTGYYLAISHYYKENGDMIADPDMIIRFDPKSQTVEALSYQDRYGYAEVYDDIYNRKMVRISEKKSQNSFLSTWLKNLYNQKHSIEWLHEPTPEPPKARKSKASGQSASIDRPDISYMNESVVNEVRDAIKSFMLDDLITFYLDYKDGKHGMRPLALYFALDRITEFMTIPNVVYPTAKELKDDYELELSRQQKERTLERNVGRQIVLSDALKSDSIEDVGSTVKHLMKLTALIRDNEPNLSAEQAKEKARQLKQDEKAEDYVIKAYAKKRNEGVKSLQTKLYEALLKYLPSFQENLLDESWQGFIVMNESEGFQIAQVAPINNSTLQYAIYEHTGVGSGVLMFAVQKVRKLAWVTMMSGNFFHQSMGLDEFMEGIDTYTSAQRIEANNLFITWLQKIEREKLDLVWRKTSALPKNSKESSKATSNDNAQSEHSRAEKKLAQLISKFPIVLEWTEGRGGDLRGFNDLDELQAALLENGFTESPDETYIKNKVWFKGYPSWARIDVSYISGDYDPEAQDLYKWLSTNYDNSFDWSVFLKKPKAPSQSKELNSKTVKKEEEVSEIPFEFDIEKLKADAATIPVFEVGKVKYTEQHKRAGLKQTDIDWINKHKQGIILTPRRNPINNTISLEKDLSRQAVRPGKRVSKTGQIYYEARSNRSDLTDHGL